MKVLQLIDSLQAGGAERVAVNIANALSSKIAASYLCATRDEGLLKNSIHKNVGYLFLNKTSTLDFKAIKRLNTFVKEERIIIIHAHSTSFFLAVLIKLRNRKVKIVWHDHYGQSEFLDKRPKKVLKLCSKFFSYVFSVNTLLSHWAKTTLKVENSSYLTNFAVTNETQNITDLKGVSGKRIVILANLRSQKDHLNALKAFKLLADDYPDWTLHLIGKDFNDEYSKSINDFVINEKLENKVFIYGSIPDTSNVLKQSTIGVLSSKSEGLPLALLEYGLASLPVIATDVGSCNDVLLDSEKGQLVPSENSEALKAALMYYINNPEIGIKAGVELNKVVNNSFSEEAIITQIITVYKKLL